MHTFINLIKHTQINIYSLRPIKANIHRVIITLFVISNKQVAWRINFYIEWHFLYWTTFSFSR